MNSINEKLNLDQSDKSNNEFNKVFYRFNSILPKYNIHNLFQIKRHKSLIMHDTTYIIRL